MLAFVHLPVWFFSCDIWGTIWDDVGMGVLHRCKVSLVDHSDAQASRLDCVREPDVVLGVLM